jgi:hypothetical protein
VLDRVFGRVLRNISELDGCSNVVQQDGIDRILSKIAYSDEVAQGSEPRWLKILWHLRCVGVNCFCRFCADFAYAVAGEVEAVSVVDEAVEDGVGKGRVVDHGVPILRR